ncbi:DNA alkylation repair protein [Clostridium isatidis]|uniref:DNA alkylation repair protein n=1 Tax=Clostridium isatidis TaxID=182773 RepID=A0A343JCQ2_9CLOT|nr:DNA alkylation repair protein [Clostridium isatidis]ASW43310.1 DNA alkylation repair protein [Clostridium isatidis]
MNIIDTFIQHKNPNNAAPMKAYMKNKFEFLGIKTPLRRELEKPFFKKLDKNSPIDREFVKSLWKEEYREFQYLGVDYLIKEKKKLQQDDIHFIKELIINKSWWDTIDLIASHLVGEICQKYPELIDEYILKWSQDKNIWLRRTAILFQLKYKENTNTEVLEKVILNNNKDNEFFIEKAIGWVLREYSKSNKEWVSNFIVSNNLSKLSIKEGSKYLK